MKIYPLFLMLIIFTSCSPDLLKINAYYSKANNAINSTISNSELKIANVNTSKNNLLSFSNLRYTFVLAKDLKPQKEQKYILFSPLIFAKRSKNLTISDFYLNSDVLLNDIQAITLVKRLKEIEQNWQSVLPKDSLKVMNYHLIDETQMKNILIIYTEFSNSTSTVFLELPTFTNYGRTVGTDNLQDIIELRQGLETAINELSTY